MKPIYPLPLRVILSFLGVCLILACRPGVPTDNAQTNSSNRSAAPTANSNVTAGVNQPAGPQNSNQQIAQSSAAADCGDCWAHFFDDRNFKLDDDNHKLCGPGKWPSLRNLPGAPKLNWSDEIESLRVGPSATVIVWTEENFTGISHSFEPGTSNASLKTIPNLSDNISSIEIRCR
jgi:hypothetical protein